MQRKILDTLLFILIWPLMLKVTLAGLFNLQIGYWVCLLAEFTLFGACRIAAIGLRQGGSGKVRE